MSNTNQIKKGDIVFSICNSHNAKYRVLSIGPKRARLSLIGAGFYRCDCPADLLRKVSGNPDAPKEESNKDTKEAGERAEHTPGPWSIDEALSVSGPPARHYLSANGKALAIINGASDANARLIAAAPALLDACNRSLSWLSSHPGNGPIKVYDQVRAAITRAEKGAQS